MIAKKRILLVEDDPSVLKMTNLRLEHEGFTVIAAMDGQAALEQVGAIARLSAIASYVWTMNPPS